jgi:hypothetical protein
MECGGLPPLLQLKVLCEPRCVQGFVFSNPGNVPFTVLTGARFSASPQIGWRDYRVRRLAAAFTAQGVMPTPLR